MPCIAVPTLHGTTVYRNQPSLGTVLALWGICLIGTKQSIQKYLKNVKVNLSSMKQERIIMLLQPQFQKNLYPIMLLTYCQLA